MRLMLHNILVPYCTYACHEIQGTVHQYVNIKYYTQYTLSQGVNGYTLNWLLGFLQFIT